MMPAAGAVLLQRFKIEKLAGKGGMGSVYRAHDAETGRKVALKLLESDGPREMDRFLREGRVLAGISHPGVVGYVGHGHMHDGTPYLAMEWLEGEDLSQRLKRGRLRISEALTLAERVLEALAYTHVRGIMHRDLKPGNLFLRDGNIGKVTLLDFGISRHTLQQSVVMTQTGELVGTPAYMAPEQARGQHDIGPGVDVFSLGCILYECLVGQSPFDSPHLAAVLAKILFEDAPRLRDVMPTMPEPLERLVARMLEKDPAIRPYDGQAVLDMLRSLESMSDVDIVSSIRPPRVALVGEEQRLVSVILSVDAAASSMAQTNPDESQSNPARAPGENLRAIATAFGARMEWLANGTFVATLAPTRTGAANDLATHAARFALRIKEILPSSPIALATGRSLSRGDLPMGEALDRAALMLREETAISAVRRIDSAKLFLDETTASLLDSRFHMAPAGRWHVLVEERLHVDESRKLLGKPTPCVGREQELNRLESCVAGVAEDSTARAIVVMGGPGMGKSRLRHELMRRIASREDSNVEIIMSRGDAMGAGSSYGMLANGLRRLCGVDGAMDVEEKRAKFSARIATHLQASDASRISVFLGEMCGILFPDEAHPQLGPARLDPKIMGDQMRRATLDFLRAECEHQMVLVILEDLHWSDALTVKTLELALRELSEAPFMVLGFARPEIRDIFPKIWSSRAEEINLRGLSRKASERLIAEVLGSSTSPDVVARIIAQSAGNALYLEELIRSIAEGKGDELPESVLAMLTSRLGRLDPGARRVLRAASIIGETFWAGAVNALLGDDAQTTMDRQWLELLTELEIIQQQPTSRYPSETEYMFRHALMRDSAYGMLTDDDRRLGHRLAGEYLEQVGEQDPFVIAEHYVRSDEPRCAVPHYARAATRALDRSDLDGVLRCVERAVANGADGEHLGTLRATEAWAYFWRADFPRAFPAGLEALTLLSPGSYHWCRAMGNLFMTGGLAGRASELGPYIMQFAKTEPEPVARTAFVEAAAILATVFSLTGQRQKAYQFLAVMDQVGAAIADSSLAGGWTGHAHNWHIRFLEPDPWGERETAFAAAASFLAGGDQRMHAVELVYVGISHWDLGDLDTAETTLRHAMSEGERLQEILVLRLARVYLALLLTEKGDPDKRSEAVALAAAVTTSIPGTYYAGLGHCAIAEVKLAEGALDDAEAEARKAVDMLRVAPPLRPLGYATLVHVLLGKNRAAEASAVADEGLALVESLGGAGRKEMKLRVNAVEARLATGNAETARTALADARRALDTRSATIADASLRARYLTGVPDNAHLVALLQQWLPEN